ncbi:MAG: response regulator [Gemmatimonadetes bacterium]|nr:response regulator [Gemmatimonadota bacterium]
MDAPAPVLALAADLLFAARIRGAAQAAGVAATTVNRPDDLVARAVAAPPRLVLVDLDARGDVAGAIRRLKGEAATASVPLVAFVSHVRTDAIADARAAGADRVVARSAFVRELPALMRRAAGGNEDAPEP